MVRGSAYSMVVGVVRASVDRNAVLDFYCSHNYGCDVLAITLYSRTFGISQVGVLFERSIHLHHRYRGAGSDSYSSDRQVEARLGLLLRFG